MCWVTEWHWNLWKCFPIFPLCLFTIASNLRHCITSCERMQERKCYCNILPNLMINRVYLRVLPFPNSTQSLNADASVVRRATTSGKSLQHIVNCTDHNADRSFFIASWTWRHILVSASSWSDTDMSEPLPLATSKGPEVMSISLSSGYTQDATSALKSANNSSL